MTASSIWRDARGASAVEFALTAPIFFMIVIGLIEFGLLLWAQIGLQHGAEMAARCASVNPGLCGSASAVQTYAANQAFGLHPPPSTFTVATPACGTQVSATYSFGFIGSYFGVPAMSLKAQFCFPK